MFKIVIEMPKGDNHRRHLAYDKSGIIDLGPLIEAIPLNGGCIPVHYGFITDTKSFEGDEVDVILVDESKREIGEEVEVKAIALISREDQDHKIVAVLPDSKLERWEDVEEGARAIILEYFGFKHKITGVLSKAEAESLINQSSR